MAHKNITDENGKNLLKDGIIDFTAGFLGGTALVYVGQPLDTVKVKMQTFPHLYQNMVDCFMTTLRTDGIYKGLYAGTVPSLAANIAENAVLFLGYGFCQKYIARLTNTSRVEELSLLSNASAGGLAAFFSSITLTPTELIKCKLQAMYEVQKLQEAQGKVLERVGPFKLTRNILRSAGLGGLFSGFGATVAREMPGYFCFFGGYEGTRILLSHSGQAKEDVGLLRTMIAGAVGGIVFWTVIFPLDVAKSRIQVQNITDYLPKVIYDIWRKEGVMALYTGLFPTIVRTIPATATLFVTVEYSKKFMYYLF